MFKFLIKINFFFYKILDLLFLLNGITIIFLSVILFFFSKKLVIRVTPNIFLLSNFIISDSLLKYLLIFTIVINIFFFIIKIFSLEKLNNNFFYLLLITSFKFLNLFLCFFIYFVSISLYSVFLKYNFNLDLKNIYELKTFFFIQLVYKPTVDIFLDEFSLFVQKNEVLAEYLSNKNPPLNLETHYFSQECSIQEILDNLLLDATRWKKIQVEKAIKNLINENLLTKISAIEKKSDNPYLFAFFQNQIGVGFVFSYSPLKTSILIGIKYSIPPTFFIHIFF